MSVTVLLYLICEIKEEQRGGKREKEERKARREEGIMKSCVKIKPRNLTC